MRFYQILQLTFFNWISPVIPYAHLLVKVSCAWVTHSNGGIIPCKQCRHRSSYDLTPPHHHSLLSLDLLSWLFDELQTAAWSTGNHTLLQLTSSKLTSITAMKPTQKDMHTRILIENKCKTANYIQKTLATFDHPYIRYRNLSSNGINNVGLPIHIFLRCNSIKDKVCVNLIVWFQR